MSDEDLYPPVDAAFPTLAVLKPFYNDGIIIPADPLPDWAEDGPLVATFLALIDDLLRDLTLAGYRASMAHLSLHDVAPGQAPVWLSVDFSDRRPTVGEVADLDHYEAAANATIHIDLAPYVAADGTGHGADLARPAPELPDRWDFLPGGAGARLTLWGPGASGSNRERLADLETSIGLFREHLGERLSAVLGGTAGAGLFWLFDPAHWFGDGAPPPDFDHLVTQLYQWAGEIWTEANASSGDRAALAFRQTCAASSMEDELGRVDAKARTYGYFAGQSESRNLPASEGTKSPLAEAVWQSGYFDLLCMLVQRSRIQPPLLDVAGLAGFWAPPEPPGEAMWVEALATESGYQLTRLRIYLHDEPAVDLTQRPHPDDPALTPDLCENAAWEYLGLQPDGTHVIGLSVGRGVEVFEHPGVSWPLKLELFLAQSDGEIRRPLQRPVELAGRWVPDDFSHGLEGEDGHDFEPEVDDFEIEDGIREEDGVDGPAPGPGYTLFEDLSLAAGQRLDIEELRAPRRFELVEVDDQLFSNVTGRPTLFTTRTEEGGIRFDWYRDGVPNAGGGTQAAPDYSLTITPRDPKAGDFGVCWSLDYAKLYHRSFNQHAIVDHVYQSILEGLKISLAGPIFFQLYHSVMGTSYYERLDYLLGEFLIGYLRVWYSGEVDVSIVRTMDSDEDFRVELVKVHEVMRLPKQGLDLPCRNARFPDTAPLPGTLLTMAVSAAINSWLSTQNTYDEMVGPLPGSTGTAVLDPPAPLREWTVANLPEHLTTGGAFDPGKIEHVFAAEPFMLQLYGPSVPALATWSDVRLILRDPGPNGASVLLPDAPTGRPYRIEDASITVNPSWEWTIVQSAIDIGVGLIPIVGDYADAAETVLALTTGKDKWGQPVSFWGKFFMVVGTCVPFVSSGVVRKLSDEAYAAMAGASAMGLSLLTYYVWQGDEDDQAGRADTALKAFNRMFMAVVEDGPQWLRARQLNTALEQSFPTFAAMTRAERRVVLEGLMSLDELAAMGAGVGRVLARGAAEAGLVFDDLLDATGKFRSQALEEAYLLWLRGRNPAVYSRRAFMESRKYTSGFFRLIAATFGFAPYTSRRLAGTPQTNANFPHLIGLVLGQFPVKSRGEIIAALESPGILISSIRNATIRSGSNIVRGQLLVQRYGDAAQAFLLVMAQRVDPKDGRKLIDKMLGGSDKIQSPEDAMLVILQLMEVVADQHMQVGRRLGGLPDIGLDEFTTLANKVANGTASADELAEFDVMFAAMADLMNKGLGRSAHWHGYAFEYRLAVILSGLGRLPGAALAVIVQATIKGKAGPDFVVRTAGNGFAIVQAKAYMALRHLLGMKPGLAHEVQLVTDLSRIFENGGRLDGFADLVFNGKYICVFDDDWLIANGQIAFDALFEVLGNRVTIPKSALDALLAADPAMHAKVVAGATVDGASLTFDSIDGWMAAAQHLNASVLDDLMDKARTGLAAHMATMVSAMANRATLQQALEAGDDAAERMAATFAAIMNTKTGVNVSPEDLMTAGAAETIFGHLKLADGWLDDLGGVPEIEVVGQAGLEAMDAARFSRTVTQ